MKKKWLSISFVLLLTLMACQMGDDSGQEATDNPNIDPTTNRNAGDFMTDNQNRMGHQNDVTNRGAGFENRDENAQRDMRANDEYRDQRGNQNDDSRYEVANEAAERITDEVDEIDRAYVLTTRNNAYVAANLDSNSKRGNRSNDNMMNNNNNGNKTDGEELTDDVKDEIGEIVRSIDKDIDNVYVSTNPDFFNLSNNYADDLGNNKPVRGMFDQIGNMIERIFPQNTGN